VYRINFTEDATGASVVHADTDQSLLSSPEHFVQILFHFVLGSMLFNFTQMKILDYANDMIQLSAFTQLINKQLVCYISCFHAIVDLPMVLN